MMELLNERFHSRLESYGPEGPIRCIFLCEFHPTVGPKITCQVPDNYISKELFDSVSVYIITKADLERSTLTVTLRDLKILGFPVRIEDKRYARNAFHFNLCFVCDASVRIVQYEPVLMKLSDYLLSMELEGSFLSGGTERDNLAAMLQQVMEDLNTRGECALTQGPTATHLKVVQVRMDPTTVADHQVPVFLSELPVHEWDLTTLQVAPYIDGFNHVARIAAQADVENNLVKACIQNLIYYGVVALVPIFQYGNVYAATPKLRALGANRNLQERCLKHVARSTRHPPSLRDIFRMYCSLGRGTSVREMCTRLNPQQLRIHERKLVQFGVLEGLIRRVHKYPILLGDGGDLQRTLTGAACLDEICCSTGANMQQLEEQLEKDQNVVMLWK